MITIAVAFTLLPGIHLARAYEFAAFGRVRHEFLGYGPGRGQPYQNTANFAVYVRDCRWLICSTNSSQTNIDYFEAGQIGKDSVLTTVFDSSAIQSNSHQGRLAIINGLPVPRFTEADEIPLLWFGYASKCYLNSLAHKGARMEEINTYGTQTKEENSSRMADVVLRRLADQPNLPAEVAWLSSSTVITTAVFSCRSTVKTNELVLPDAWVYEIYGTVSNKPQVVHTYRVDHTTYSLHCPLSNLDPRLSPSGLETMVNDYRLSSAETNSSAPVVTYSVTNRWLTREELGRSKLYREAADMAANDAAAVQRGTPTLLRRRVTMLTLGVISLLFLIVIAVKSRQDQVQQE